MIQNQWAHFVADHTAALSLHMVQVLLLSLQVVFIVFGDVAIRDPITQIIWQWMSLPKYFIIIIITHAFLLQAHLSVNILQNKSFLACPTGPNVFVLWCDQGVLCPLIDHTVSDALLSP